MNKTEYFVFHKEWYELRKELSAKAWFELEDYMLKLRFDGIDTDPKSIKNKTIRLQWIMIRKKIYDSINNMKRQKKHRSQNNPDLSATNIPDDTLYTPRVESPSNGLKMPNKEGFESQSDSPLKEEHVEVRNLTHVNPNIIPQEEFITDEEKYGSDVMDLIEDNPEIITALKSVVEYNSGDIDKEYQAKMANTKINQIVRSTNIDNNFIRRVENFCADYMKEYKEHKESNNYI